MEFEDKNRNQNEILFEKEIEMDLKMIIEIENLYLIQPLT